MVNSISILNNAKINKYAIPQFNINNLEWTKYILEECQQMSSPVILGVSEGAIKYMGGYDTVSCVVKTLINDLKITIPVVLHLDHGSSIESCINAIESGFTSVMIDASKYEINENIRITQEVVEYAKLKNVSVEAEIGHIGGAEDAEGNSIMFATVEDCIKMWKNTEINSLAPALGSVHGLYKGEPNLNYKLMKEINDLIDIPLVLHGGTGINDEKIREAISNGTSKININTELQIEWSKSIRQYLNENTEVYDPRKIISSGEKAMKEVVKNKIVLFNSVDKAGKR